jgi:hypothetical protein
VAERALHIRFEPGRVHLQSVDRPLLTVQLQSPGTRSGPRQAKYGGRCEQPTGRHRWSAGAGEELRNVATATTAVLSQNLNPNVMVMQAAKNRERADGAGGL